MCTMALFGASILLTIGATKAQGIALVQHTSRDAGSTTLATLAFHSNNTAGNWIGVCVRAAAVNEIFTVTDSNGNAYHKAIQFTETGDGKTFGIFYAEKIAGGANTIKVSDTVSATLRFAILEYSGVATSGSLDATATSQGKSASPNTGNAVTTSKGDLLLGAVMTSNADTFTAGAGYNIEERVSAEPYTRLIAEDQIQANAGTASASASLGTADFWAAGLAAFKAAGSGVGASPSITATPANALFGNVPVGTSNTQTIQLKNTGASSLTLSSLTTQGTGFGTSGLTFPSTLAASGTATLNVAFSPTSTGIFGGLLTLLMNGSGSSLVIPLTGTGVAATRTLSINPTSLNFGNVLTGGFTTMNVALQNAGNSSISIASVTSTGLGLSTTGVSAGTTIASGQTAVLATEFAPKNTGSVTGAITISSNTPSAITIPVTGTGVSPPPISHVVDLSWEASPSTGVVGYNVYRSTLSGGPYTKLVTSPVSGTSYSDTSVQSNVEYYYVVTAIEVDGAESSYSNQVAALVP